MGKKRFVLTSVLTIGKDGILDALNSAGEASAILHPRATRRLEISSGIIFRTQCQSADFAPISARNPLWATIAISCRKTRKENFYPFLHARQLEILTLTR